MLSLYSFHPMEYKMSDQLFVQLSCLLPLAFSTIIFYKWQTLKNKTSLLLPPGPICYPIIGCFLATIKNKPTYRWMHRLMQEMETEIACFRLGNSHVITVTSPELACEFLKKNDAIFASRPKAISARLISNGYKSLITSPYGEQWKKMRRVLASEVLPWSMHKLHDKRCAEANQLIQCVYNQSQNPDNNGLVDVRTITQHFCANVMRTMIFNKRSFGMRRNDGSPGMEDKQYMEAVFTIISHVYGFAIADFLPWLEGFDFDGHEKITRDAVDTLRKFQDPEIDKRTEMWRQGIRKTAEDILDLLINLKDTENNPLLTIQEIKAHIAEMIIGAVDNPANAVEWSLAEMINQPDILTRACKELDRVVGKNKLVQESDLPKLNYIKACAKESFRLHPVVPFNIPHLSSEDVIIGGYLIPKGSRVLLSRRGLGRNPRVWNEPLKYNPERHMNNIAYDQEADIGDQVELGDHKLRILAFSTGRRGCPCIPLGSTLTTMLLARLVQGFHWKAPPNGPPAIDLAEAEDGNLLMKKPLFLQATPRLEPQVYLRL